MVEYLCAPSTFRLSWFCHADLTDLRATKQEIDRGVQEATCLPVLECWNNSLQTRMYYRIFRRIWHSEDRASWYILIIKPTRCTNANLFLEWDSTCFGQVFCKEGKESLLPIKWDARWDPEQFCRKYISCSCRDSKQNSSDVKHVA
jgi:hypothetical protein